MSEQRIPHLSTLLRGRGGRGRGRGRGGPSSSTQDHGAASSPDAVVQRTDDDAAGSRMSAVDLGYLQDRFARAFWDGEVPRRYPIMNRGTFVRTTAIDTLVDRFLDTYPSQPKQIVSFGAGTDTRYFRILSRRVIKNLVYHEIDFPSNTSEKIAAIRRAPQALATLQSARSSEKELSISVNGDSLYSPTYNIHPLDLRELAGDANSKEPGKEHLPNLFSTTPTLLLSECCLIYLPPSAADSVLTAFSNRFIPPPTPLALIVYEPIRPNDPFGQVMISNLATRGIVLQTLKKYSSLFRQKARLQMSGFTGAQRAADVDFLWENWISEEEKERINGLEMLDEVEEWRLLAQHYCVAWGWRDGEGDEGKVFDEAWNDLQAQDASEDDAM